MVQRQALDVDLEAAAKVLGVHYQTAYRWVRSGLLPAAKVGTGYDLDPADVERLAAQRRLTPSGPADRRAPDWDAERVGFFDAFSSGAEALAMQTVDGLVAAGASPLDICEQLVTPALRRAGELAPEDAAVAVAMTERILGRLASPPRGRPRGLAVVASPEGELHRLPSLIATVALRADRWRVHHLGADVTTGELVEFVRDHRPDVVVLSVTVATESGEDARDKIQGVTATPVVVGETGAPVRRLLAAVAAVVRSPGPRRPGDECP